MPLRSWRECRSVHISVQIFVNSDEQTRQAPVNPGPSGALILSPRGFGETCAGASALRAAGPTEREDTVVTVTSS